MHSIYRITNQINSKSYIGQSINPYRRWNKQHIYNTNRVKNGAKLGDNNIQLIHLKIAEYGIENFEFQILEEVDTQKDANLREEHWAEKYSSYAPAGYNIQKCGEYKPPSEETKRKISEAQIGKKISNATREKLRQINLGKILSEEHKKAISEGMKNSEVENKGQFIKGQKAPTKAFKKGHVPWNTGKSGYKVPALSKAKLGKTKYTMEQILEMKRLKMIGHSYRAIAREFSTVHSQVKKLINEHAA